MLKRTFIIVTSLLFITASCKKEEFKIPIYFPGSTLYGEASAKKEGKDWNASAFGQVHGDRPNEYFGLRFGTFSEDGFARESMSLNEIPFKTGVYEVRKTAAMGGVYDGFVGAIYITLEDDGDAVDDVYYLDESVGGNELEITFIDTVAWVARGTFNLSFVRDENESNPNPLYPDNVKFSNGVFEVQFLE